VSTLELYGTDCCHLCEAAKAVLDDAAVMARYIDIAGDESLLEKYAVRIPVLRRTDNGVELGWPFDPAAVIRFLAL